MPVFMVVQDTDKKVESIYAPSVTFNETIRYTGTFRWFHYPALDQNLVTTASISTRTNWNARLSWDDLKRGKSALTNELDFRVRRSVFHRFFGLGPDTSSESETSHTRRRGHVSLRRGLNLTDHVNIGFVLGAAHDHIEEIGVPNLELSTRAFPNAPGMNGASVSTQTIDLRYDTRDNQEYSRKGFFAGAQFGLAQGLWNSPAFSFSQFESRALFPETEWLQGSARLYWRYVNRPDVPFYHQSTLGGSQYLRGFNEDRFIDQGAWTAELEQRIRILHTNIFGVVVDWKIDPFISFGQVFPSADEAFDHIRFAQGVGFRAFIHPNITGRVDLAHGGEGLKVYVELGYPF